MTERPHDLSDLHLAPVALDLDRRVEELSHDDRSLVLGMPANLLSYLEA